MKTNIGIFKLTVLAAAVIFIVAGFIAIYILRNNSQATTDKTSDDRPVSMFVFEGADGWRQGPSNETSMALFSKAAEDGTSACFTSIEYYKGTVDSDVKIQEDTDMISSGGDLVTLLGVQTLSIKTPEGNKEYQLHQSKITSSGAANSIMGGHEMGYLQLSEGYLKIYGNCNTAEQLSLTLPALNAYKLNSFQL